MLIDRLGKALSMFQVMLTLVSPISYQVESREVGGLKERIHTLEIAAGNPNIHIENVLSMDDLYGFEKTSEMAGRHEAEFAVNGMFYNGDGLPFGMIVHDGQPVSSIDIGTPSVVIYKDRKVEIKEVGISVKVSSGDRSVLLRGVNRDVPDGEWVLFDSTFGKTTRVWRPSMNYCIREGRVEAVIASETPLPLMGYDRVLTHVTGETQAYFEIGDTIEEEIGYSGGETDVEELFQTGGWLVRDGKNAARDYESFMGYTTAPSPRTLVGITRDNRLIFKVVDGRWPGVSSGVSGYEAAVLMMAEGCVQAAYLDGGASSTLVIDGTVVNHPSEGEERTVAHGILIQVE